MGNNTRTTEFLKECMADSLIKLLQQKTFNKITVEDITKTAGVHRTTWFRNFSSKNEAITFKLRQIEKRYAEEHMIKDPYIFNMDNAKVVFELGYEIRDLLQTLHNAGLQSAIYDAFYQSMTPPNKPNTEETYEICFNSYGLWGLQDKWIQRGFRETPDEMIAVLNKIVSSNKQ